MALEGDLGLFSLSDVLQVVAQQRKTGILTVQGKSDILAVSFFNGEIVAADALNQSFEVLLGDVLAARGSVDAAHFALLAEQQRSSGERLVDYLIAAGALRREELLESLRELTYRLLLDVLRWREGQFKFYGGEEVAFEEGIRPLRVDDVLMRALGDLSADPGRSAAVPHGFMTYVPAAGAREVREIPDGFDEATPLDPSIAWLTPEEMSILGRLDGKTTADRLARRSGVGETRTYFVLHRLLQAGLIEALPEGAAAPEPELRPAPPAPAAAAAPAPRGEALRVERAALVDAATIGEESPERARWRRRSLLAATLVAASWVLGLAFVRPGAVLFPAPNDREARDGYERLLRLSRFDLIDRALRTYHLLDGRYPPTLDKLVELRALPDRALADPSGVPLVFRSEPEEYRLLASASGSTLSDVREGVFGDFLLDRQMFAGLEDKGGVPIVLVD